MSYPASLQKYFELIDFRSPVADINLAYTNGELITEERFGQHGLTDDFLRNYLPNLIWFAITGLFGLALEFFLDNKEQPGSQDKINLFTIISVAFRWNIPILIFAASIFDIVLYSIIQNPNQLLGAIVSTIFSLGILFMLVKVIITIKKLKRSNSILPIDKELPNF